MRSLQKCKVTSAMWDEAMEIMKKKLNLWIHEMMTNNKSAGDSIVVKLKAKEIYSHFTQGHENVKTSLLVLTDLLVSKGGMA